MNIDASPSWMQSLSPEAINSISVNNKRITNGSDDIIVNPSFKDVSDDDMHKAIQAMLSKVALTERLRKLELDNMSSTSPRSIAKSWVDRRESLSAYFNHTDHDPGKFVGRAYGTLRPQGPDAVGNSLIKSSSAGLPYMIKKGRVLHDALAKFKTQAGMYPCVLYTRTQEKGKTRNIWGYPISDTISEQTYFLSYLNYEKNLEWRSALVGPDEVDRSVTALLASKTNADDVMAMDFSSFDASVTPEHAYNAFSRIALAFQPRYHDEVYRLFRRFVTIPVYTPEGEWSGPHGVPSGSSFTNTIDSLVQYQCLKGEYRCQIQGDDGVYVVPKSKRDLVLEQFEDYGLEVNQSKSDVFDSHEALYLQRYYHPDYKSVDGHGLGGVYPIARALNRIKYLERWTDFEREGISGEDFFTLRTITILENCKHHPAFEALVRYARDQDKYGLRFSDQGLKAYSRMLDSRARAGVFNQYGDRGLQAFKTVQLLNTL